MKILQVIDRFMRGGGAEKFILDLSLALNKIPDVEVEILSVAPPINDDFVKIAKASGISHTVLSNELRSLKNISLLGKFIKRGAYDIVHVHLFPALYYAAFAKKIYNLKSKFIFTEHSTDNRRMRKSFRFIEKSVYRQYDEIVGITSKVKAKLETHLGTKRIQVINNGIDINAISNAPVAHLKDELSIPENSIIVTMVSRINPIKDFTTLINASELLPDNFHILFVGDGPSMNELKTRAAGSSSNDRIHILGLRSDVFAIIKASDMIVLSSHHEGFSIAMLESMSAHRPFVGSEVEGIKDLVTGVAPLFKYQDAESLSQILLRLHEDRDYYQKVAANCFAFAQQHDINRVASQYYRIFNGKVDSTTNEVSNFL